MGEQLGPVRKVCVYADENWTTGAKFKLIGSIWAASDTDTCLRGRIAEFRAENGMTAELKWGKVSRAKLQEYSDFVDLFFAEPVGFHCIVLDCSILDWRWYHRGDEELGFYKFYFQLLSRKLKRGCSYYIRLDERNTRGADRLSTLEDVTNKWWNRERPAMAPNPVKSIEPRDSKKDDLVQLADVILGATAAAWNGVVTSAAKLELIAHIEERNWRRNLNRPTSASEGKFNI